MNEAMEILGLVPARSGSKGIKDKNVRLFRGKPLLAHAIECARQSGIVSRVVLSTDSPDYQAIGRRFGAEADHLRPPELAEDDTPMADVIAYELQRLKKESSYEPDAVALLQPTQPLRQPRHLLEAKRLLAEGDYDSVVSVIEVPQHYSPRLVMKIVEGCLRFYEDDKPEPTRRQEAHRVYFRDGTVYLFRVASFLRYGSIYGARCAPYFVDPSESLMLDEEDDWKALLSHNSDSQP